METSQAGIHVSEGLRSGRLTKPVFVERWTTVSGWKVHSRSSFRRGGIPFVLIHGLVISISYFVPLAKSLAESREVHAIDLPGFGRSEGPHSLPPISRFADLLFEWLKRNGIEQCHLVANSLGCQVASEFAHRYPASVATLTLIGPTIDPAAHSIPTQGVRLLEELLHQPPRLLGDLILDFLRCGPRRMVSMISRMFDHHVERILPHPRMPAMVMCGECDPIAPERWAKQAAQLLPDSRRVTIPGGHHCVHFTHPSCVAGILLDFTELAVREPAL